MEYIKQSQSILHGTNENMPERHHPRQYYSQLLAPLNSHAINKKKKKLLCCLLTPLFQTFTGPKIVNSNFNHPTHCTIEKSCHKLFNSIYYHANIFSRHIDTKPFHSWINLQKIVQILRKSYLIHNLITYSVIASKKFHSIFIRITFNSC